VFNAFTFAHPADQRFKLCRVSDASVLVDYKQGFADFLFHRKIIKVMEALNAY
jgi:hypothetical protein